MGWQITKDENDKYTVISSISDEVVVENATEHEVKKAFIENALFKFAEEAIKIDMMFPYRYRIDGKFVTEKPEEDFYSWFMEAMDDEEDGIFTKKFAEVLKKYDLGNYLQKEEDEGTTNQ